MLKMMLAQLNLTVGDIEGNVRQMIDSASRAHHESLDLVVFSELAVTAYYPGDLLDEPGFVSRVDEGIEVLRAASRQMPGLTLIFGTPLRRSGPGKKLENGLLALRDGEVLCQYAKQLLPTYNIFDERRHFEPGADSAKIVRVGSHRIGVLICEDGWNDLGTDYALNPFGRLAEAAPDLVLTLNASPSHVGKRQQRHRLFAAASRRHDLPLLYVNQVGGHDQLVYDGASFAMEPDNGLVLEAPSFETAELRLAFDNGRFVARDGGPLASKRSVQGSNAFYQAQTVLGLQDYARRCGFERAVVGSSGGIDSALTLALAVQALGPDRVVAITMPSGISSAGSVNDSQALARNLGIQLIHHPIEPIVQAFRGQFERSTGHVVQGLTHENLQARARGTVLMAYSNAMGHLVLTTGNKSEMSVGYCTLYGDTNGGLGLIGDLYKTEVYALSHHLNECAGRELIPSPILEKEPSAELAPGQRDIDSLPPYDVLDDILKLMVEGDRLDTAEQQASRARLEQLRTSEQGRALIEKVAGMIQRSEYKRRQAPPIIRLRPRAFGQGRQMPIAATYSGVWS